jgi:hypothetical protein
VSEGRLSDVARRRYDEEPGLCEQSAAVLTSQLHAFPHERVIAQVRHIRRPWGCVCVLTARMPAPERGAGADCTGCGRVPDNQVQVLGVRAEQDCVCARIPDQVSVLCAAIVSDAHAVIKYERGLNTLESLCLSKLKLDPLPLPLLLLLLRAGRGRGPAARRRPPCTAG